MFQAGERRQKMQRIRGRVSVAIARESYTGMNLNSLSHSRGDTGTPSASPVKDERGSTRGLGRPSSSNSSHQIDLIDCTNPSGEDTSDAATESVLSSCRVAQPEATKMTPAGGNDRSLASWLQPLSGSISKAPPTKRQRVRDRQDKNGEDSGPLPTRAWADLPNNLSSRESRDKAQERKCKDSLSAWLEPRRPSGKKRLAVDGLSKGEGVLSPPEEGGEGAVDEGWMSARLEGLDPAGAARAKDGWTNRSKRNLTLTDIALEAKRKTQGGRGWRTTPSGGRIFLAPSRRGPAEVANGQAAFRMSISGRKK